MARRGRRLKKEKSMAAKRRAIVIGAGVFGVALIAFLVVYFVMRNAVNKVPADIIWNHISIESVDVSGMKAKEAKKALEDLVAEYKSQKIKLVVDESEAEVTLEQLGFQITNVEEVVEKAVSYGKKGSVFARHKIMKQLEENGDEPVLFEASYGIDETVTETLISEKFAKLEGAAVNAAIKRENGQFVMTIKSPFRI